MSKKQNKIDLVQIARPCPTEWGRMSGNDRVRYCTECAKYVYDFSKLTRRHAEALIEALPGKLCARITRLSNGSVLTAEESNRLRVLPRPSPLAGALMTALLTLTAGAARGQSDGGQAQAVHLDADSKKDERRLAYGSVSGTIYGHRSALVSWTSVTLTDERTGFFYTTVSDETGRFKLVDVPAGTYTIRFDCVGYKSQENKGLVVQPLMDYQHTAVLTREPGWSDNNGEAQTAVAALISGERRFVTLGGAVALPPKPLRTLFRESERVVIAQPGESKKVDSESDTSLYDTALLVTQTIKGRHKPVVHVYHWRYGSDGGPFKPGENILVFLKRREAKAGEKIKGGYELDDTRSGVKQVTDSELQVYLARLHELQMILTQSGPNKTEIVEWLVRCAEEPATRWEGAYELLRSEQLLNEGPQEAGEADQPANIAVQSVDDEEVSDAWRGDPAFAKLLTQEQKERLLQALYKMDMVSERDEQLIELAKKWRDPRLLPFLIKQLHRMEDNPPRFAEQLVNSVSDLLSDPAIEKLAADYGDKVSYEDEEEEQNMQTQEESPEDSTKAESASEPDDSEPDDQDEEEPMEEKRDAVTAIQNRSELLKLFLRRVEVSLARRGFRMR